MTASILVIDDSMMVRKQVGNALKTQGYTVVEAVDGVDALSKLDSHPDMRLVVCDVNMPRMNGLEFLEQLATRKTSVPVVMLTTEGQPELIQRAKALGAVGWLVKPFKPEFLLATAKKLAPTGT
jgi:two-component system, chemotaxis family, chemotaxis protein CheY